MEIMNAFNYHFSSDIRVKIHKVFERQFVNIFFIQFWLRNKKTNFQLRILITDMLIYIGARAKQIVKCTLVRLNP